MQIIAQCPNCGNTRMFDAGTADRRIRCKKCARLFKVPKLEEISESVKLIKKTTGTIYVDQKGRTYG